MTHQDIQDKFTTFKTELISQIETYVKETAKFKIGDLVNVYDNFTYVITQVGYSTRGIEYWGSRVKKNGEVTHFAMHSNVGILEQNISSVTLMVPKQISDLDKKKTVERPITFIDPTTFRNDTKIRIKLSL
jgi:hypothetical protein